MGRKKKEMMAEPEGEKVQQFDVKREVAKFKPTEWARQEGLDPHLFLYWENQLMDEQEYETIKKKVI